MKEISAERFARSTQTGIADTQVNATREDPEIDIGSMVEISPERAMGMQKAESGEKPSAITELYKKARPYIEPAAIGVGAGGGGMLGMASPVPGGTAIGGMLGFAGAEEFMDALDKTFGIKEGGSLSQEAWEAINNVAEGAAFETLGPILGRAGKGTMFLAEKAGVTKVLKLVKELFPSMSDRGRLLKARDMLKNLRKETPEIKKTVKETDTLFKETGITQRPTHAQKTGSIKEAAFEQAKSAQEPEIMAAFKARDAKISEQGIENIQRQFPGEETISGAVKEIAKKKSGLKAIAEKLTGKTEDALTTLKAATKEKETIGEGVYTTVKRAKKEAKKIHEGIYARIPGKTKVSSTPIREALEETLNDIKKIGGNKDSRPSDIIRQIKVVLKPKSAKPTGLLDASGKPIVTKPEQVKEIDFANLQDWQSQIKKEIRSSIKGPEPSLLRTKRLNILRKGVDDSLEQMKEFSGKQTQIAKDYEEGTIAFKKYHDVYRKGPVDEILESGYKTTGLKTLKSDMPAKFFQSEKAELADDLINAVGADKAKGLIKPYAESLFLTNATEVGVLKPQIARKWLSKHKTVLKKYGLYGEFEKTVKLGTLTEQSVKALKDYQTTTVSTILETDVGKHIGKIFSGKGKTASKKTAEELLNIPGIKDNKVAINGIQNSFKDFLLKEMENAGIDVLKNPIRSIAKSKKLLNSYMPAMKVLYKDSPNKIKAFEDYHKIMEVIARNKNVTYAGGSTTAEKALAAKTGDATKETWSKMLESAATLVAIKQGSGWVWSATRNFIKAMLGAPWKISKQETDKILSEALFNPEVAETLMMMTKGASKMIDKRIKYHIIAGKAMATREAIEAYEGKEHKLKDLAK